jgi:integrase
LAEAAVTHRFEELVTMTESNSTAARKPSKPYPEFQLTAHPAGYWCKKIRGKIHYFGRWDDPDGALASYLEQKDTLQAGRLPRPDASAATVRTICNHFLSVKKAARDANELSERTWKEYRETCDFLISKLGKHRLVEDLRPDDFAELRNKLAKRYGPTRLANCIQRIRSVFKMAFDDTLLDRPMVFGQGFKRPTAATLRRHKAQQGAKLFSADELQRMLAAADVQLRALFLLGINCAFGVSDCGRLPFSALDLEGGWVTFPRPKTGIDRRCPLWPETVEAIQAAVAIRPQTNDPELQSLVFLTAQGRSWHKEDASSPLCFKVSQLLKKLQINGRKGLGFYTLRHTFRTVGDAARDPVAIDYIMGHVDQTMGAVYRQSIDDARLKAVTDHVHGWLYAKAQGK